MKQRLNSFKRERHRSCRNFDRKSNVLFVKNRRPIVKCSPPRQCRTEKFVCFTRPRVSSQANLCARGSPVALDFVSRVTRETRTIVLGTRKPKLHFVFLARQRSFLAAKIIQPRLMREYASCVIVIIVIKIAFSSWMSDATLFLLTLALRAKQTTLRLKNKNHSRKLITRQRTGLHWFRLTTSSFFFINLK